VAGHDHHCPWLGICVGDANYFAFVGLLSTVVLLALQSLVICACISYMHYDPFGAWWKQRGSFYFSSYAVVHCCGGALFVGLLLSGHFYLIALGVTTREYVHGTFGDGKPNPFVKDARAARFARLEQRLGDGVGWCRRKVCLCCPSDHDKTH
jgi:hypothetical protein